MTPSSSTKPETASFDNRWTKRRQLFLRVGAVFGMIAISALILLNASRIRELGTYGYTGVFLLSLAANATLILPAPGWLLPIVAGSALNPLLVGLSAGAGQALGEMTGYLAGSSGRAMAGDEPRFARLTRLAQRYGVFLFAVLAFIPNPLFDIAGIVAGAVGFPWWQFLLATFIGKTLRAILFAYGGYEIFVRWFEL